jgi:hypothetical protein
MYITLVGLNIYLNNSNIFLSKLNNFLMYFREISAVSKYMHLKHHNLLLLREYTPNNGGLVLKELQSHSDTITSTFGSHFLKPQNRLRLKLLELTHKNLVIKFNGNKGYPRANNSNVHMVSGNTKRSFMHRKRHHRKYIKLRKLHRKKYAVTNPNQTHKTKRLDTVERVLKRTVYFFYIVVLPSASLYMYLLVYQIFLSILTPYTLSIL